MKTTRIAAGYYKVSYKGIEGILTKVEGYNNWYWQIGSDNVDDWHDSMSDAKIAFMDYVDCKN